MGSRDMRHSGAHAAHLVGVLLGVAVTLPWGAHAISVSSCVDLGWPSYNPSFPNVCAASIINSRCYNSGTLTYSMADSICTTSGARLCTSDELQNDVTAGSGCGLDDQFVWSSTACLDGFYAAHGLNDTALVCNPKNTGLSVRCCADHVTTPTPNPSTAEAVTIVAYTNEVAQGLSGSVTIVYVFECTCPCVHAPDAFAMSPPATFRVHL